MLLLALINLVCEFQFFFFTYFYVIQIFIIHTYYPYVFFLVIWMIVKKQEVQVQLPVAPRGFRVLNF